MNGSGLSIANHSAITTQRFFRSRSLDPSIYPGNTADYGISVTNNDPAACTSSTFNLNSSQPTGWPTAFSNSAVTLNPGRSVSLTMTKTGPAGTPPGTYAVDAIADNGTSQASGAANATVMAPPPPVTVNLTVSGSNFTCRSSVPVTASVFNGTNPVAGAGVVFTITKADGSKATKTVTTSSTGNASWNYKISQKDPTGAWSVVAQTTFTIHRVGEHAAGNK